MSDEVLLELQCTETRGRGLFAKAPIAKGTLVHISDLPLVSVICSLYRKEVCASCFYYNNGRKLKYSCTTAIGGPGLAWFCSDRCQKIWLTSRGSETLDLIARVDVIVGRALRSSRNEVDVLLAAGNVDAAWTLAEQRTWSGHLPAYVDPDVVRFLLNGYLLRRDQPDVYTRDWLRLVPSKVIYRDAATLQADVDTAILLHSLFPDIPLSTARELRERDTGNSFGIRDDVGNELLGYATYALPTSLFNHSCEPNVGKIRRGARWHFHALRDVAASEELCISYLGDECHLLTINERLTRLRDGWAFDCTCASCAI